MTNDEDVYIYKLRVKPADRKRQVYTHAKFKDLSTQTWADLSSEHQDRKSGTMMQIGKLDYMKGNLKHIKSCNGKVKKLMNRLQNSSRKER